MIYPTRAFIALVLGLLCIPMSSVRLAAQGDRRISPADPQSLQLAPDGRVQAAATIGNTTLVVWGVNRIVDDTASVNRLAARIIADGDVRTIEIDDAAQRPAGYLQVVPSRSRFLVLWNDLRQDAPGLYLQQVEPGGQRFGEPVRILESSPDSSGVRVVEHDAGIRLIWNGGVNRDRAWTVNLDLEGRILEAPGEIAPAKLVAIDRNNALPGTAIIGLSDNSAYLVGSDGAIDPRKIGHFGKPLAILSDSVVAVFEADTLLIYRSLLDSIPLRTIRPILPDSLLPGTISLYQAGSGNIGIAAIRRSTASSSPWYQFDVRKIVIGMNGDVLSDTAIFVTRTCGTLEMYCKCTGMTFKGGSITRGCDNSVRGSARYRKGATGRCEDEDIEIVYVISSDGTVQADPTSQLPSCVAVPGARVVTRRSFDSVSSVTVELDGSRVEIAEAILPFAAPVPETGPGLFLRADTLAASWTANTAKGREYIVAVSGTEESAWMVRAPHAFTTRIATSGWGQFVEMNGYSQHDFLMPLDGWSVVSYSAYRADRYRYIGNISVSYHTEYATALRYLVPTLAGWTQPVSEAAGSENLPYSYSVESAATIPGNGGILVSALDYRLERNLYWIDTNGRLIRKWSNVLDSIAPIRILPLGGSDFIALNGTRGFRVVDGRPTGEARFDAVTTTTSYHAILGGRLLRLVRDSSDPSRITASVVDPTGTILSTRPLLFASAPSDICVTTNPLDSTIALVYSAGSMIAYSRLEPDLREIIEHERGVNSEPGAVRRPSAIFHRDSLLVAWEDDRNRSTDIYMNAVMVRPQIRSYAADEQTVEQRDRPDDLPARIAVREIYPNPASGSVELRFDLPVRSDLLVEIYSIDGEIVRTIDLGHYHAGTVSATIPLDGLARGNYYLRLRSDSGTATTMISVVPVR